MVTVAMACLAAALVIPTVAERSIGFDEGVTFGLVRADLSSFADTALGPEVNMSGYYMLLRVLGAPLEAVTDPVSALRLPSALAVVVAVVIAVHLGRALGGRTTGVLAAVLLFGNRHVLEAASTARSYAFVLALSLLTTERVLATVGFGTNTPGPDLPARYPHAQSWRRSMGWGALGALSAYFHVLALVTLLAQVIGVAVAWPRRVRALVPGLVVAAVAVSPLLTLAARTGTVGISWIPQPRPADLAVALAEICGGLPPLAVLLTVVGSVLLVPRTRGTPVFRFLLALTLIPIAVVYLESALGPTPLLVPRYLVATAGAAALLVATAATAVPRGWLRLVAVSIVVLAQLWGLVRSTQAPYEDFRTVAHLVAMHQQPGDALAFSDPGTAGAFAAEWQHAPLPVAFPPGPPGASMYDGRRGFTEIHTEIPEAVRRAGDADAVWLVLTHDTTEWAGGLRDQLIAGMQALGLREQAQCVIDRGVAVRVVLLAPTTAERDILSCPNQDSVGADAHAASPGDPHRSSPSRRPHHAA